MRNPDLAAAAGVAICTLLLTLTLCGAKLYANHMRYQAFSTAQSTILSCRAKAGFNAADKLCGPVPSMADFE